jgi:putative hemolysin
MMFAGIRNPETLCGKICHTMLETVTLFILLALSAFFSGSETAITTLSKARVEALLAERRFGAKALHRMKGNLNRTLVILLIGNNLVNTAAATLATVVATEHFGHLGPGLAVGFITLLLLMFGEITPKTYGSRYAIAVALLAAAPLELLGKLLLPLVWALEGFIQWMHSLSSPPKDPSVTETELIALAEHGTHEGSIEVGEHQMIRRIFDFSTLRASDIMVHRHQIFSLDGDRSIGDSLNEIIAESHYRIPLYSGHPEEINRVITLQNILSEVAQGNLAKTLNEAGSDPLFVPPNQPVDSCRTRRHHGLGHALGEVVDALLLLDDLDFQDVGRDAVGFLGDQPACLVRGCRVGDAVDLVLHPDHHLRRALVALTDRLHGRRNRLGDRLPGSH